MFFRAKVYSRSRWLMPVALLVLCPEISSCRNVWGIEPYYEAPTEDKLCVSGYDESLIHEGAMAPLEGGSAASTTSSAATGGSGGGEPAMPLCSSFPNVVFVYGSDSVPPILQQIAPRLAAEELSPTTIVYAEARSCAAVDAVIDAKAPATTGCYYTADSEGDGSDCAEIGARECLLDGGQVPDIGVSDIYPETCNRAKSPDFSHRTGPIQASIFVTAMQSSMQSISREAARVTYDPMSQQIAPPWSNENHIFQRIRESGTQRLVATYLGLSPDELFRGMSFTSSSKLIGEIEAMSQELAKEEAAEVLGFYDVSNGDRRAKLGNAGWKPLALMADDGCAYLPDESGFDKRSVRNGHYPLWSPLHFVTRNGAPNEKLVKRVADLILMDPNVSVEGVSRADVFATWVTRSFVPECAMTVARESEMGPLLEVEPTCVCAFEDILKIAPPGACPVCDDTGAGCPEGYHCDFRFNYCERN